MNEVARTLVIEARGVSQSLPGPGGAVRVLENVNLAVATREAMAIVGPSGAGKSTLLSLLAGLDRPSAGQVWLMGQDLGTLDEDGRARVRSGSVGFVFQNFQLLPHLTALENVRLPLELGLGRSTHIRHRATEALARVGLGPRARHYPHQLSGGEQQRVALARAFVTGPRVLFADEPTGNLDGDTGRDVADLLFTLRDEHDAALVLVTHDATLTERCDRRQRLHHGRLSAL